jgi:hypothetical protein
LVFDTYGTKLFVIGAGQDAVQQFTLSTPYDLTTAELQLPSLDVSIYDSGPTGPKGLRFNEDGDKLFILSDGDEINQFSLSTSFNITHGVTYDGFHFSIEIPNLNTTDFTFNNSGNKLFVVGQGNARGVYQYSLATPFDITSGVTYDNEVYSFSGLNPFGITFNASGSKMMICDGNFNLYQFGLNNPFDISSTITLDRSTGILGGQAQGMAFNGNETRYFVLRTFGEINEYSLRTSSSGKDSIAFKESSLNDGSVEGSIIVTLVDDTFTTEFNVESNLTIDNLPEGLIPTVSLSSDKKVATISLNSNAINNDDSDDINNLGFTFGNGAFTSSDASKILNATDAYSGLGIEFISNDPIADYPIKAVGTIGISKAIYCRCWSI